MALHVHSEKKEKEGENYEGCRNKREKERKIERTKKKRSKLALWAPKDKVSVCWYDQSYDKGPADGPTSGRREKTRRKATRQEEGGGKELL